MAYDYVRRTYDVDPKVGGRVVHTVTAKSGTIARENKTQGHYVQVRFDGQNFNSPCHPTELNYQDATPASHAGTVIIKRRGT